MSKICIVTKKRTFIGNKRSHSMRSSKRKFIPNMHNKKFWLKNKNKYIKLFISTKAIKIIKKKGIENVLSKLNIKF